MRTSSAFLKFKQTNVATDHYLTFTAGVVADNINRTFGFSVLQSSAEDLSAQGLFQKYIHDGLNRLYSKKMFACGDSLIAGLLKSSVTGESIGDGGFVKMLADKFLMTYTNSAIGGSSIARAATTIQPSTNSIPAQLDTMLATGLYTNYDYFIFDGGFNDYYASTPVHTLGVITSGYSATIDDTTVLGGLEYCCKLLQTNFPRAKKLYMFPHRIGETAYDTFVSTAVTQMKTVLKKWDIPFIDCSEHMYINLWLSQHRTIYGRNNGTAGTPNYDTVHLSPLGYEEQMDIIDRFLN